MTPLDINDKEAWRLWASAYIKKVAEDVCSVQPMGDAMKPLQGWMERNKHATPENLVANGYEPVCKHGLQLLWTKKERDVGTT